MSNYAITVDTDARKYTDESLASFYRNVGVMQSAVENMKGGVRGLRAGIQRANRCFLQMDTSVRGVLSGLMNTRNVVDGLQAGMKNLNRYSRVWWRSFADTLQSLAGNAVYLRNSLAAMAAPMLKNLAPAIELVTDKFVGLFNLINQFFARLTGASSYVAAKRVSGGIDGVGSSASRASNRVKELKRQLTGFDELNVLSAPENASGGGSGGGSGGVVQFEERPIDSGLAGFVDALKAAFDAGDWQELGTLIGAKINEMIEGVDWAAFGSRVGYYVNGLFSTAYWTLETVNFANIGASVAELLNSALAEIDFTTVGATVALLFTSLAETVAGFVDEFDWVQFAEKLADGLNGFVAKLGEKLDAIDWGGLALKLTEGLNAFIARTDWANAGKVLAGRVNDLLEILSTVSARFDWSGAGAALASAVNGLFKNVDWDGLGTWLNDTLLGVLDLGVAFFQGFDAAGFAGNVQKALTRVDWDAVSEKLWSLFKAALDKLGEFFGTLLFGGSADMKLNLALLKDGWESIARWLGIDRPLSALIGLLRDNWQSIAKWLGIDDPISALVGLVKNNWTSIAAFVGTAVSVATTLTKNGWKDIASFVGTAVSIIANLTGEGSNWKAKGGLSKWFGDGALKAATFIADLTSAGSNWSAKGGLSKWFGDGALKAATFIADLTSAGSNWSAKGGLSKWFGDGALKTATFIANLTSAGSNWKEKGGISKWFGDGKNPIATIIASLKKSWSGSATGSGRGALNIPGSQTITASLEKSGGWKNASHGALGYLNLYDLSTTVKVFVEKAGGTWQKIKDFLAGLGIHLATGGVIANGRVRRFASGGVISGGVARYLAGVPHYAGGTTRAHGTVFVAGEAGPEIMGHINGRTEILNKSQLAQTMYSAVLSAMGQAVSALGTFLSGQLANCTNAIVKTVGGLSGVANIRYHEPVMASGTVLPYDVAAQIARTGSDIQNTLDANNEDLIQTIISVAGQIVAAVQGQGNREQATGNRNGGLTAQQLIDDINRRAQMFGSSPILD